MADNTTIKCADCGHSNEPERVYCHNCGAKLDRSLLPKPADKKESAEQARKRYHKMSNPTTNIVKNVVVTGIKVLVGAALVSSIALMLLPPEDAPEKNDDIGSFTVRDNWSAQTTAPKASAMVYPEKDLNAYLKTLKSEDGMVKFKGAYAKLGEGTVTIWVKRELWGLPMWSSVVYHPTVKGGKLEGNPSAVHYGRLGVPTQATFAQGWGVAPVFTAIAPQFKDLDRLQDITIADGKITVTTKDK